MSGVTQKSLPKWGGARISLIHSIFFKAVSVALSQEYLEKSAWKTIHLRLPKLRTSSTPSAQLQSSDIGMGNTKSSKKNQQLKTAPQKNGQLSEGKKLIDTKNVLLLHKSNAVQLDVLYNFRDALLGRTEGTVDITDFVNIADGNEIQKDLKWLDEFNNVALICLTSESIKDFQRIIHEKGFADQNGYLHPKLFSITFGEKLTSEWPPKGLKKGSTDLRDFHFGFSDVDKLRQQDFEESLRLNSLIAAMKLTS